jgi:hypothetical protein
VGENELFEYSLADGGWAEIVLLRYQCEPGEWTLNLTRGFVQKGQITAIESLAKAGQQALFRAVFERELKAFKRAAEVAGSGAEPGRQRNFASFYHSTQFSQALNEFKRYQCEHSDADLFDQFLTVLETEAEAGDDLPAYLLGSVFECRPEWTFAQVKGRKLSFDRLEWGLVNIMYSREDRQAQRIKKQYNGLRAEHGLAAADFSRFQQ